jgi:hypothetical protein
VSPCERVLFLSYTLGAPWRTMMAHQLCLHACSVADHAYKLAQQLQALKAGSNASYSEKACQADMAQADMCRECAHASDTRIPASCCTLAQIGLRFNCLLCALRQVWNVHVVWRLFHLRRLSSALSHGPAYAP